MVGLKQWPFGRKDATAPTKPGDEATATQSIQRAEELIAQGNTLEDSGDLELALERYRQASRIAPDFARAWVNIGNALQLMGKIDEAIPAQETALRLAPDSAPAHYNLGALLARKSNWARAEGSLREALRLRPEMADAAIFLADVLATTGRMNEAEEQLRRALELRPKSPIAANNLAGLLIKREHVDDAEDVIRRAKSLNPDVAPLNGMLGLIYVKTGRAREAEPFLRAAIASTDRSPETESVFLFSLNLRDDLDAEAVFREHRRIGAMIDASAGPVPTAFANRPDPDRPLRIGYVSGDFRQHPVGLFLRPILERHNREHFEVHCYANNAIEDDLTRTLRHAVPQWHSIVGLADAVVADRIRQDGIDILVDLSGHTAESRLPVFSHRPAPVQVTWLGYLNTTGLATMDYRLCDSHTDPSPSAETLHTERLIRLPNSQWCYAPVYSVPVPAQPHAEDPDTVVFGSFNQFAKISDACLATWCDVLATLPEAKLRVYGIPEGRTRSSFLERLGRRGLEPARVSLHGRIGILEYFSAIGDVDVALDTFPYNGATTTLDTLWMGVPIVGLQGNRAIARGTYSILRSLQTPELIATTLAEYVERNVRLAQDLPWRREIRSSLRARLELSSLMDVENFAKALESSYRRMWQHWCHTQAGKRRDDGAGTGNPSDPKRCHDLGNALRAQGKLDEAVASYRQALTLKPDFAEALVELAATLHQQGKPAEAVESYRSALALQPDLVVAHYNLANALNELGQLDEAVASYRKSAELQPNLVAAHYSAANVLRVMGRSEEAIASYRTAICLKPDFAEAYCNLGLVFQVQHQLDRAVDSYRHAISIKPDFAEPHNNLGVVLNELGLFDAAVASYRRALELNEAPEFKTNFVRCIKNRVLVTNDAGVRRLVARAIAEPWAGRGELTRATISLVKADIKTGGCVARASKSWPRRLASAELFGSAGPTALAHDVLLRTLLENSPASDVDLERCLTMVRRTMLDAATAPDADANIAPETLTFYCALARQCFINEYVFSAADEEFARATALRDQTVATLKSGSAVPALWVATIASYFPLLSIPGAEMVMHRPCSEPVAALLVQQIAEPLEERRYHDTMPRLTAIEGGVSSSVRQQYEENPYPRWMKLPPAGKVLQIDDYLRQRFPSAAFRPLAKGRDIDILIAGCGTGQESIATAQQFPTARILAVDLSLASLAYAKRKTREIGLTNIEYAQADIMNLRSIGRTFDVMISVGVLHHLDDPVAGLHELTLLLRPRGVIHLGLYSERARKTVVAARKLIRKHGYAPSAPDIRRCRQDLIERGPQFAELLASGDFYTMSDCRDLLFHVQEHQLTLPRIKKLLRSTKLDFKAFSLDPDVARQYASRFPGDKPQTDLDHWNEFESDFPHTFAGMYKFWAQKPGV